MSSTAFAIVYASKNVANDTSRIVGVSAQALTAEHATPI